MYTCIISVSVLLGYLLQPKKINVWFCLGVKSISEKFLFICYANTMHLFYVEMKKGKVQVEQNKLCKYIVKIRTILHVA